ncbi:MAG: nuclear transport factor 2 family protein [Deinococcales bacterium]
MTPEIQEMHRRFEEAYNSGTLATLADLYAADAVLYTADGAVHKGRQAVIQALAGRRDEIARRVPGAEVHFTASATEGEVLGDTVYELGNYAIGAPGGRPVMHGAYVIFGKRVGEAWKITRHLNTGHLPAPTEAKKLAGVA